MPVHSSGGTRFGKASPPSSIGRLAPYNPGQVCHRSRKAFYVARPRAYVASLSLTHCYGNAGHKRSFSAHSHCGGRCLARFSFVGTAVALTNAPLRPRAGQPPAPPGRSRLAHPLVYTQGFHKRQAALAFRSWLRCLRSLRLRLYRVLGRTSAWLKTHARLLPRLDLSSLAPRGPPQPCHGSRWSPVGRPLVACPCLSSSPPGAFSKPLRGIASPGALAAPGVFPPSFLRRSKLKACKLKASYQQVKSFLTHSPRPRPSEGARSRFVISYAYPW